MSVLTRAVAEFDAQREAIQKKIRIHTSYKAVFSGPQGDDVLLHIMEHAFVTKSTFVQGDPEQTLLNEGSRRLALSILRMARRDHQAIVRQLEKELE
jgi:hypothetical protein